MSNKVKTPEDILLINKPKGISSFDVIRQLRKKLGIRNKWAHKFCIFKGLLIEEC